MNSITLRSGMPILVLLLAPIIATWPVLIGYSMDPLAISSSLLTGGYPGLVPGFQSLDINLGLTTQALGHLAAEQWLHGEVPWWNPFNGIGLPLAGEMQPSALFLPFVLLLHFQNGPVLLKIAVQMVASLSCFGLLRSLGISRWTAMLGGVLFSVSGAFAWLGHAPVMPIGFLPLFLWGIERARTGGYRMIAVALALSITAGFPETAYLDGLLALTWAVFRLANAPDRWRFAARVTLGGTLGLLMAAPALWSFIHMLANGTAENHAVHFANLLSLPLAIPGSQALIWLLPYIYGGLFGFDDPTNAIGSAFGFTGGYFGALIVLMALLGITGRRDRALRWVMLGWIVFIVGGVTDLPVVAHVLYALPLMRQVIVARFCTGAVMMALIVLAIYAIEDWRRGELPRLARWIAVGGLAVMFAICLASSFHVLRALYVANPHYRQWLLWVPLWAATTIAAVIWLMSYPWTRRRAATLAMVLSVDAVAMFSLPLLASPWHLSYDTEAVRFLHDTVGLQRFYTLGPYRPNYGAYFETPQLNHEYLPIPANWVDYIHSALDPSASSIGFRGDSPALPPGAPSHTEQMLRHLANFEELGVRFIVTPPGENPFAQSFSNDVSDEQATPRTLGAGDTMAGIDAHGAPVNGAIDGMGVKLGTYRGQSDGQFAAELCVADHCASGTIDLGHVSDNAVAIIALNPPLQVTAGAALRWRFSHQTGRNAVAVWVPRNDQSNPRIEFTLGSASQMPPRVYQDHNMAVYELPNAAPYFQALGGPCRLDVQRRTKLTATCDSPATLVRRELFFSGWRAQINGATADIIPYGEIMQQIALPAGTSNIRFNYAPPYAWLCWALTAMALLGLLPRRRS